MGYEYLALGAAFLWAVSTLLSVQPASHLGSFAYSRWRMACSAVMLSILAWWTGGWKSFEAWALLPMALSGLTGIFIGDTALFACFNRMGPRQAGLLFSCHAVFSALLGYWIFAETMTLWELFGALLVFSGVVTAIFFRSKKPTHQLENLKGSMTLGVSLGLLSALCQALGGVFAKPVVDAGGIDPVAASAIRMITAFFAHCALWLVGFKVTRALTPINGRIFLMTALNALLAMVVGMTLILFALQKGDVGMVALLSSMTPIMLLPLLWFYTRQQPSLYAWCGAIIAVLGSAILVS